MHAVLDDQLQWEGGVGGEKGWRARGGGSASLRARDASSPPLHPHLPTRTTPAYTPPSPLTWYCLKGMPTPNQRVMRLKKSTHTHPN